MLAIQAHLQLLMVATARTACRCATARSATAANSSHNTVTQASNLILSDTHLSCALPVSEPSPIKHDVKGPCITSLDPVAFAAACCGRHPPWTPCWAAVLAAAAPAGAAAAAARQRAPCWRACRSWRRSTAEKVRIYTPVPVIISSDVISCAWSMWQQVQVEVAVCIATVAPAHDAASGTLKLHCLVSPRQQTDSSMQTRL